MGDVQLVQPYSYDAVSGKQVITSPRN